MDDNAPEFLDFEDFKLSSVPKSENVLKLDDPPQHDTFLFINPESNLSEKIERKISSGNVSKYLLDLSEPQFIGDFNSPVIPEPIESIAFADKLLEPNVTELIAKQLSQEITDFDIFDGNNKPIKVKSLNSDGFEIVKKNDVEKNDGVDIKRPLENLVFKEELQLDSNLDSDHLFSDDILGENNLCSVLSDDIFNEMLIPIESADVPEDTLVSMTSFMDSIVPCDQNTCEYYSPDMVTPTMSEPYRYSGFDQPYLESFTPSFVRLEPNLKELCKDVIMWANPVLSTAVFGLLMFVELGMLMGCSLISLLAASVVMCLLASMMHKVAVHLRYLDTPSTMNCVLVVNKEDIAYCVDITVGFVDKLYQEIRSIAYVESLAKNFKVLALLWALTYVGSVFNFQSLIFIGSLLLFSLPLVHTQFKKQIAELCHITRGHIDCFINK